MRPALSFLPFFFFCFIVSAQDTLSNKNALELIKAVQTAQRSLKTVSYTLARTDTFVSGTTRVSSGRALIQVDRQDSVFGFMFQARKDGYHGETVYDGHTAYSLNDDEKTYTLTTKPSQISHITGEPGGQMIFTDLVILDTSKAADIRSWEDERNAYILFKYADLKEYDVTLRSKLLTINKATMLPMAMRSHQETLGKVQDLYYVIKEIRINPSSPGYDFSSPGFLKTYSQKITQPDKSTLSLKETAASDFTLASFAGSKISLSKLKGKLVLLDFWEVWCGPCVESMPKVQHIYEAYKNKGLQVFGIINDVKQLEPAKRLVEKRGIMFPMLVGNEQLVKDYKVNGVPQYVLIDEKGKIIFISTGYSGELETVIKNSLP